MQNTVRCKLRLNEFVAYKLQYSIIGCAGDYLLITPDGGVAICTESEFNSRFELVDQPNAKPKAKPAAAESPVVEPARPDGRLAMQRQQEDAAPPLLTSVGTFADAVRQALHDGPKGLMELVVAIEGITGKKVPSSAVSTRLSQMRGADPCQAHKRDSDGKWELTNSGRLLMKRQREEAARAAAV